MALDRARQSCAPGQRTPYDVQITLDAQETTRFKQHPPSLRAQGKNGNPTRRRGHVTSSAVVLRSVLQNCRGVPFKGPRSLGGSRLKGPSKDRGVQGGRGAAGGWGGASQKCDNVGLERGASQKCDNVGLERGTSQKGDNVGLERRSKPTLSHFWEPRKKWKSDPQESDTKPQWRWFCARSFKKAVMSP